MSVEASSPWVHPGHFRRLMLSFKGGMIGQEGLDFLSFGPALLGSAAVLLESRHTSLRVKPLSDENARWLAHFLRSATAFAPAQAAMIPSS